MEDYCNKIGLPIVQKYRGIESSTNGNRTKFNEMLDFVRKQKKKTAIVVHCIDRFQRRFNECVEVETLLLDDKIDVHFCKEGLILTKNSPSFDIMRWDMGILSGKMYVANLRDNVNRGMNYNWSIGKYQTKYPVGYLNIPKTKTTPANIISFCSPLTILFLFYNHLGMPHFCLILMLFVAIICQDLCWSIVCDENYRNRNSRLGYE